MTVIALALACSFIQASGQAKVTLQKTENLAALAVDLTKASGVMFSVTPKLAGEILIVSVSNAPLSEVMDRIAWSTLGNWERKPDGYHLVRDGGEENRSARHYREVMTSWIGKCFRDFRDRALEPGASDTQIRDAEVRHFANPYTGGASAVAIKAFARLTPAIPPEELLQASNLRPIFFSSAPSAVYGSLGPNSLQVLRTYLSDKGLPANKPVRATAYGHAGPTGGHLMFEIRDAGDVILDRFLLWIDPLQNSEFQVPTEILSHVPADAKVPLSEGSRFFSDFSPKDSNTFSPQDMARWPEVIRRLANPEIYDPLATFMTDLWVDGARRAKRNLIANVDDDWFVPSIRRDPPLMKPMLTGRLPASYRLEDSWLTVRPAAPKTPWLHRLDRAVLGRYVRSTRRMRGLSDLRACGEFAVRCGTEELPSWVGDYAYWASAGLAWGHMAHEWAFPRFFGSLPETVQNAWLNGDTIDASKLSDLSRDYLRQWAGRAWMDSDLQIDMVGAFPQGLPTGELRAEVNSEPGFFYRFNQGGRTYQSWNNLPALAGMLKNMATGNEHVEIQEVPLTRVQLSAVLGSALKAPEVIVELNEPDPSKYVRWRMSPPETVQRIVEAMAKIQ